MLTPLLPLLSAFLPLLQDPPLPDFSRAGYHAAAEEPPRADAGLSVTDFGARPGDAVDDGPAIQRAIEAAAAADGGVVLIPAGVWRLETTLKIDHDGVVLRGAGSDRTILDCPKSLADVRGPSKSWSWSGAWLQMQPAGGAAGILGHVPTAVPRGATQFAVELKSGAVPPRVGEWLELHWFNDKGEDTLLLEMHGGVLPRAKMGKELRDSEAARVRAWVQVLAWEPRGAGHGLLTIDAPLRLPLRPQWRPQLRRSPYLKECGVEGISFVFPKTPYPGHLKERGYNAIQLSRCIDSWVFDVTTDNADSGLILGGSKRITARDLEFRGRYMHHPIALSWTSDCLVESWRIEAPHRHGTTLSWSSHGNVLRDGFGNDLAMDCHRAGPFENLHEEIVIQVTEQPQQPFRSGGSYPRGPHAAANNIYWNVEVRFAEEGQSLRVKGLEDWPRGVFAGWRSRNGTVELKTHRALGHRELYEDVRAPDYPNR